MVLERVCRTHGEFFRVLQRVHSAEAKLQVRLMRAPVTLGIESQVRKSASGPAVA